MNKQMMWVLVVVALLVGAFGGYFYEKSKLMNQLTMVQAQLDSANMKSQQMAKDTVMKQDTMMAAETVMMAKNTGILTDAKGMTLYTFDKDTKDVSNCTGSCLVKWPPFVVNGQVPATLPANLGTFKNAAGAMQYSWKGMPLYYFQGDQKAGDTTGDGVGGVWHVAK